MIEINDIIIIVIISILLFLFFNRSRVIPTEHMGNIEVHKNDDYNV
jgi:hypothetical protein